MLSSRPDEGWAWVVLFASFCSKAICGYGYFAIALFTLAMQQEFPNNELKIAWISGVFLCSSFAIGK